MPSFVSWNVLGPFYEKPCSTWEKRYPKICSILAAMEPDFILLQEVPLQGFTDFFRPLFSVYTPILHEQGKKRSSPMGNVIFYKADNYLVQRVEKRSRAIHIRVIPRDKTDNQYAFWITNVHFSAGLASKQSQRIREWESCKQVWGTDTHVVVGGDFNERSSDGLSIRWKQDGFLSTEPAMTCHVQDEWFDFDRFLVKSGSCKEDSSIVSDLMRLTPPFPNEDCPSDHIPICMVWNLPSKHSTCFYWGLSVIFCAVIIVSSIAIDIYEQM